MDSKLVLFVTFNADHSEISGRRREWVEGLRSNLDVFKTAGVPVAISIQGRDLQVAGMWEEDLTGHNVLAAPYAHALEPLLVGRGALDEHHKWLVKHGVKGNVNGRFLPEFAPSARQPSYAHGSFIPCLAGRASSFYSRPTGYGYVEREEELERAEAVSFRGQTWLPMHGVEAIASAYQFFQRFPDMREAQDEVERAIKEYLAAHPGETRVVPMDFEACLVGSHHGAGAWEMFFNLLERRGLTDVFTSFHEAIPHWARVARKLDDKPVFIDRDLSKWRCRDAQRVAEDGLLDLRVEDDREQPLLSLATTSDRFSAMSGWMGKGVTLTADRGAITIRASQDMALIGEAAARGLANTFPYRTFYEVLGDMRCLGRLSTDGLWYANRVLENRKNTF